ncbi:MAG: PKD domain-containing protein [Candidatus Bathyarchaeia archaeon]
MEQYSGSDWLSLTPNKIFIDDYWIHPEAYAGLPWGIAPCCVFHELVTLNIPYNATPGNYTVDVRVHLRGLHPISGIGVTLEFGDWFVINILEDKNPPESHINISGPNYTNITTNVLYITSDTTFILGAVDDFAGVTYSSYRIDEGSWLNYTGPFKLSGLSEGLHIIIYSSVDRAKNIETQKKVEVFLYNTPPISTLKYDIFTNKATIVTIDAGSGVSYSKFKIDGGEWMNYTVPFYVPQGARTIWYYSVDNLGNAEEVKCYALLPLSVSISPSKAEIKVRESVTFTSTLSGGALPYSYQWFVNGPTVVGATSQSWTFTSTTPGIYILHLNVTDSAQQTAKSNTAILTVAPQLMVSISPTSASILTGTISNIYINCFWRLPAIQLSMVS